MLELSKEWVPIPLKNLGFLGRGKSKHRPRNDPSLYGGKYPFIQTGDVTHAEYWLTAHSQTYSDKGLAQSKLWPAGTLCITIAANIAETAVLKIDACFPDSVVGFIPDPLKANTAFIKYSLDLLKQRYKDISRGTTQDNLSLEKLNSIEIRVPPLSVQDRIAFILRTYDDLIEVNQRRIAILEEIARRLFDEWFVRFRYPGHEAVPVIETETGMIPEGWHPRNLRWWADEARETVFPQQVDPHVAYVGLEHLPRRSTTLMDIGRAQDVTSSKLQFAPGDILFGKIRPYFHKVALMPFAGVCSTDAICIRVTVPKHTAYVLGLVSSDAFVANAVATSNGTKMPRADWKVLKNHPLPEPPEPLLALYEQAVDPMVQNAANLAAQNHRLRTARDLLLPKLISGEIDVSAAEETFAEAAE